MEKSQSMAKVYIIAFIVFAFLLGYLILNNQSFFKTHGIQNNQSNTSTSKNPIPKKGIIIDTLVDNDFKIGSEYAPIIMIEFSDPQCPYSRDYWATSFQNIKKDYIQTGKVQYIFREFPLTTHPMAQKSAEAEKCAATQGKYEEMRNKIFQEQNKQGAGLVSYTIEDLKKWAAEINLSSKDFNKCLDSGQFEAEVSKDFSDGNSKGISATPSFILGKRGGYAQVFVGSQDYTSFQKTLEKLLK